MGLLALILAPLGGAIVVMMLRRAEAYAKGFAIGACLVSIALAVWLWVRVASSGELAWTLGEGSFTSIVTLFADGISIPLAALTAVLGLTAVLASLGVERVSANLALLLALQAAVTAVFLAADLVLLYVAWEAVLIPMFFLIGGWGHENRRYAAMKFFIYTFAGSALMLVGIVMLAISQGGVTSMADSGAALTAAAQVPIFWLLAAGFLVKVPVWPLHTWLPDAHVEAPTGGSIMLAGVLLKMGGYGLIRLCMGYTPDAFARFAPVLAILGIIGIVYGAAMALAQTDLKRLIAYSSVGHMGFVVLALSTASALGLAAAMLGMVSHGLVAGLLFFLAGALYDRAHTRELAAFGGVGVTAPGWAAVFVFASLASLGLPGLSGFPGEFGAFAASFARYGWPIALAGLGVVLAGGYSLRAVRMVVHGEPREGMVLADLAPRELFAVLPLVVFVVALGLWPRLVTDVGGPAVDALVRLLGSVT